MSSPSKHARKSLKEISPEFQAHASSSYTPMAKQQTTVGSLRASFRSNWPAWNSLRLQGQNPQPLNFTVKINDKYRHMTKEGGSEELINDTVMFFKQIQTLRAECNHQQNEALHQFLEDCMIEAIYGSNAIEEAGLNEKLTARLCRAIFRGQNINPNDIDEQDPDYAESLGKEKPSKGEILRSRIEVIQHAKAFDFMVKTIVENSQPITEGLLKECHKILCYGQELDHPAGEYRIYDIAARYGKGKSTKFIHPKGVPQYMENMCADLNTAIQRAENTGTIDPMSLAAQYCSLFVNIHPFADGNGRMCRLLLNSILLKYAGVVVAIGEAGVDDRKAYLELTTRASKKFHQEDMEVAREDETAHYELGVMVTKKAKSKLKALYDTMRGLKTKA